MRKTLTPVLVTKEDMKGLYLRGEVWWYQFPMREGVRHKPISLDTTNLLEAIEKKQNLQRMPILAESGTLAAETAIHLVDMKARGKYTEMTARAKESTLRKFVKYFGRGTFANSLTEAQIRQWYLARLETCKPHTVHKQWNDVRAFFTWLVARGKIRTNPAKGVEGRDDDTKIEPPPRVVRAKFCEMVLMDQLINNCPREDLKLVLMLGFHAGLRRNEILHAVPEWFDFQTNVVRVGDTAWKKFNRIKKARWLPMRSELRDHLVKHGLGTPWLVRPDIKPGSTVYRWDYDRPLREYLETQTWEGADCTWVTSHVMRHTFASLLAQQGMSLWEIALALGNTPSEVERVYAHLNPRYRSIELKRPIAAVA